MELSDSGIKNFFIFFGKKYFLIFQETELSYTLGNENPEEDFYIFSKESFSYIPGNKNPVFYISERNFPSSKGALKLIIFQERTCKP